MAAEGLMLLQRVGCPRGRGPLQTVVRRVVYLAVMGAAVVTGSAGLCRFAIGVLAE